MDPATGALIGGIADIGIGIYDRITEKKRAEQEAERQYELQSKLNENAAGINYKYGEQAAANAHARTQELIADQRNYDSPEAVRSRLEAAGMNPALMYGGASAGGGQNIPSGAQGATGGASAGTAQGMSREQMRIARRGMALQVSTIMSNINAQNAQAEQARANAKLAEVEAEKKRGTDTEKSEAETANLIADTKNKELIAEGQRFTNKINETNADIISRTKELKIEQAQYECDAIYFQMMSLSKDVDRKAMENEITEEQKETIINSTKAKYVELLYNIAYVQAATGAQNKLAELYGQQYWESYSRENLNWKEGFLTDERRAEIRQMVNLELAKHGLEITRFEHQSNMDYKGIDLELLRMEKEILQSFMSAASNLGSSMIMSGGFKKYTPPNKPYTGVKWSSTNTGK